MKSLSKLLSMSIVLTMLLGIVLLIRLPGTAHASVVPQTSPKEIINWQSVIAKANPYVHVMNGIAIVDSRISQSLSQEEVSLVNQSVTKFNSLPSLLRSHPQLSGTTALKGPHSNVSQLAYQWSISVYWWGVRLWINSAAAQSFGIFMGIAGAAIGGAIGNIIGAAAGAVIGAIIGGVTGSATALADYACGGRGAFIDITWISIVSVSRVC